MTARARLGMGLASPSLQGAFARPDRKGWAQGRRSAAPWRLPALHFSLRRGEGFRERVYPHPDEWAGGALAMLSFPRTRESITTTLAKMMDSWLWVPAFAGTTTN